MIKNIKFKSYLSTHEPLQKMKYKLLVAKCSKNVFYEKKNKNLINKKNNIETLCIPDQIMEDQIQKQTVNYHIDELRERVLIGAMNIFLSICICLSISKDLLIAFEINGLKNNYSFLQLNPGEFFFTSLEVIHKLFR
mmetsp:Transcript_25141/g.35091  ORF Transcript_25141/g.35091 Transcript_25141/m.35091 type:complete len:137 (+) Transcript_25141:854-1264(+)